MERRGERTTEKRRVRERRAQPVAPQVLVAAFAERSPLGSAPSPGTPATPPPCSATDSGVFRHSERDRRGGGWVGGLHQRGSEGSGNAVERQCRATTSARRHCLGVAGTRKGGVPLCPAPAFTPSVIESPKKIARRGSSRGGKTCTARAGPV